MTPDPLTVTPEASIAGVTHDAGLECQLFPRLLRHLRLLRHIEARGHG
jgi:hypothetical protein